MEISIVIPVYNTEEYLTKCLDSVINQTYKDMEIIVVDDCSPGNCEEIVSSYQVDCIRYIKHEVNKGLFTARETGVRAAQGRYIVHIDSDDWIATDLIKKIHDNTHKNADLIIFDTISVTPQGLEKAFWTNKGNQNYSENDIFYALCDRSFSSWATWGKVYNRKLALEIYDKLSIADNLTMAEDLLFFSSYVFLAKDTEYVPCNGYYYNLTNVSVNRVEYTTEKAQSHLNNLNIVINNIKKFANKNGIEFEQYDKILSELCQSYLIKISELKEREQILLSVQKTFGERIIMDYIFGEVERRDDKIRMAVDDLFIKIFPKKSNRYKSLRFILLKILGR